MKELLTDPFQRRRLSLAPEANSSERRRDARYPTHDQADVEVLAVNTRHLSAVVLDVSKSGLRIEVHERIGQGSEVRIRLPREVVIHGEVRYCRRAGTGFHAGILIAQVFQSAEQAEQHLFDGEMSLYLLGKGLSAAEVLRLRKHLNDCESCRLRVAEAEPILRPGNRRRA
jgi:nitrous oxidase accessory protein NosD